MKLDIPVGGLKLGVPEFVVKGLLICTVLLKTLWKKKKSSLSAFCTLSTMISNLEPFRKRQILDSSKLKEFATTISHLINMVESFSKR